MADPQPVIRPIRREDMPGFGETMRGWAVELDGRVVLVAGVMYTDLLQAFSTTDPVMKRYPKVVLRVAKMVAELCSRMSAPVFAIADDGHPRSPELLRHIGFVQVDDRLYRWEG